MIPAASFWIPTFLNFNAVENKKLSSSLPSELEKLTEKLTSSDCCFDQWFVWKDEIKKIISQQASSPREIDKFIASITEWGMRKNPQKMKAFFVDLISFELFSEVIRSRGSDENLNFTNIIDLATKNALECPFPIDTTIKGRIFAEWKRLRPVVIYFIPNLLNIFLGAFNFLDTNKKFTTLWEKHLLLEIVYKFFIFPIGLIQLLRPIFIVSTQVYLVASLIIFSSGILISCYQRWFRPLPDEIVNCTNLDKQMERGDIDHKVERADEIDRLIGALETHDNIILRALSGEGKTALIHHFMQLKGEGKLSKKLQELIVFEVDCGIMISSASFGHSELINQTKEQINGHESRVLLFFDDFYQIATNQAAFLAFKKRFLEDKPRCKSILAVTLKEWEELKKLDTDESFRRKTHRMVMGPSTDEQIAKILKNCQLHIASDVYISDDTISTIISFSADKAYLPNVGRPAKAEEIFKTAVGICRAALNGHYDKTELDDSALQINKKLIEKVNKILSHRKEIDTQYYRLSHKISKIALANDLNKGGHPSIKNDPLGDLDLSDSEEDEEQVLAPQSFDLKKMISEEDQTLYIWYCFYARKSLEKLLKTEIEKINKTIPIQVNKTLLERVFNEIKKSDAEDKNDLS